jgi:hypothetical protein
VFLRVVTNNERMSSCQGCWRTTEMAQRSNRRFLNLISVEVVRDLIAYREEGGRNPSWPGVADSTKGRIHWRRPNCRSQFFACNSAADHTFRYCGLTDSRSAGPWSRYPRGNKLFSAVSEPQFFRPASPDPHIQAGEIPLPVAFASTRGTRQSTFLPSGQQRSRLLACAACQSNTCRSLEPIQKRREAQDGTGMSFSASSYERLQHFRQALLRQWHLSAR